MRYQGQSLVTGETLVSVALLQTTTFQRCSVAACAECLVIKESRRCKWSTLPFPRCFFGFSFPRPPLVLSRFDQKRLLMLHAQRRFQATRRLTTCCNSSRSLSVPQGACDTVSQASDHCTMIKTTRQNKAWARQRARTCVRHTGYSCYEYACCEPLDVTTSSGNASCSV